MPCSGRSAATRARAPSSSSWCSAAVTADASLAARAGHNHRVRGEDPFGELLDRVSRGEEVVITPHDKPVARLVSEGVQWIDVSAWPFTGHQQVTDAYLVGPARHHNGRVVTVAMRLTSHADDDGLVTTITA